jgi:hypothetical protein
VGSPFPPLATAVPRRTSTGEVFFVREGCLHYVPDPQTLTILGLVNQIRDVPESVFDLLPRCSPLPRLELPMTSGSGTRVFLTYRGERHAVPDKQTLDILRLQDGQHSESPVDVSLPAGAPLPPLRTRAVRRASTGEVFYIEGGCLHYVPDPETISTMNLWGRFADAPENALDALPVCAALPHGARPR